MNFKNLLLTTDFSPSADAAIPYAFEIARRFGGSIKLLYVLPDMLFFAGAAEDAFAAITAAQTGWAMAAKVEHETKLLAKAAELSASEHLPVEPIMRHGNPALQIIEFAKQDQSDLIVIATHGRTGLSHLLSGSVAERVIRLSVCPVLSIRPLEMNR